MIKSKKVTKAISYRLQFIESTNFMASSLTNLVKKFAGEIHIIKCKCGHDNKKNVKHGESNAKIVSASLNTQTL